ncbi:MAG: lipoate--protein ligase family protein [bacterium]|nr:lipoate--protein ligase family protein [bacterium]PIW12607.1 MAG: octanoyltransferase [Candidatus Atribacteria bacterium CG17_big_fil_post_rev_8_21_14_2_50_34_11]
MEWRLIKDSYHNGFINMAIDEAIMIAHREGLVPPTIRFYQWSPAAVSLGYFQDLKKEINIKVCQDLGIDMVRRPTGGKAVLHDQELTYSFIIKENDPLVNDSILETYKKISGGIIRGLSYLGIKAELVPLRGKLENHLLGRSDKARIHHLDFKSICFSVPSQYEVQVEGKKMVGSAQVRKGGVVLQHGSLLIKLEKDKLFSVFNFPSVQIIEKLKSKFKATSLEEILKKKIDFSELSNILPHGFEEEFGVRLVESKLTESEEKISKVLLENKYSTYEWNYLRKNNQLNFQR